MHDEREAGLPPGIQCVEASGSRLLGPVARLLAAMEGILDRPRALVLDLHRIRTLDRGRAAQIAVMFRLGQETGTTLLLASVRPEVRQELVRWGVLDGAGTDRVFASTEDAIAYAMAPMTRR